MMAPPIGSMKHSCRLLSPFLVPLKFSHLAAGRVKFGKPVTTSDIMGNKTVEVRPVGAWVRPEAEYTGYEHHHGVVLARQEETRICNIQKEKEEKLKRFQEEVKRRVKVLDQVKKRQMIEKSVKEIEMERNVVRQSAFAKGRSTTRKDNCTLHKQSSVVIQPTGTGGPKETDEISSKPAFTDEKQKAQVVVKQARKNLMSRQVIVNDFIDDVTLIREFNRAPQGTTMSPYSRMKAEDTQRLADMCSDMDQLKIGTDFEDLQVDEENIETAKNVHFGNDIHPGKNLHSGKDVHTVKNLHFGKDVHTDKNLRPESASSSIDSRTRLKSGKVIKSKVPEIYGGVLSEDEKRRKQVQHAMYRRLFMDIEREQVKENLRRKQHRKTIARLKKEKEEYRKEEEAEARRLVEPRDPITGETEEETLDRERTELVIVSNEMKLQQARLRKAREMERYVDALKFRLRERIQDRDIQLPSLCCCGVSIWDTNPETCANNCVFYKNPKGYAKALQSLLSSFDVL